MAIQSADVTYLINSRAGAGGGRYMVQATVGWPSGKTYDTGGIPIVKGKLGIRAKIENFSVMDPVTPGYSYVYDVSAETLKLFVPVVITSADFVSTSHAATQDFVEMLGERSKQTNFFVASADAGTTTRLPAMLEISTGDTITSATLDVYLIGHH